MRAVTAFAALAVAVGLPVASALARDDLRTISHHSSLGSGNVSEATEVAIDKPERIFLKIRTKPNVRVEGKFIQALSRPWRRTKRRNREIQDPVRPPRGAYPLREGEELSLLR
jgi:hypothetical protein